MNLSDLTGLRFGRLTVVSKAPDTLDSKYPKWRCVCDCGSTKDVVKSSLMHNLTTSCGCLRGGKAGGLSKLPEYSIWYNMKARCTNNSHPFYSNYGGRGIEVCERWETFPAFLEDMGSRPASHMTLDRKDSNLGYCKENCQWATRVEQSNNTRRNVLITHEGVTQSISRWAAAKGMQVATLAYRLKTGVPVEVALSRPMLGGTKLSRSTNQP